MWYWLSVYALVIIAVAVPFLLLYLIGLLVALTVTVTRFAVHSLKTDATVRKVSNSAHWTAFRRKAA